MSAFGETLYKDVVAVVVKLDERLEEWRWEKVS